MINTFDVVIVGGGVGALTAVLAPKAAGLSVVVLEKTDKVGGNSALSGGVLWVPNNRLMAKEGVEDSFEAGMVYLENAIKSHSRGSTRERRAAFLRSAPETIAFLQSQGIPFQRQRG